MPETQTTEPKPVVETFPDVAKSNAEVIAKTESQGRDTRPETDHESAAALDAMWKATQAEAAAGAEATVEPVEERVVVEKKDVTAEPVADVTAEAAPNKKSAEDELFKGIDLPPKASPRSAEAFASIKIKAAQEIAQRDAELEKTKAELEEVRKTSANPLTPELEKEIAELREFRMKMDIESDPKFKEFDKRADGAAEFIYSRLKANGVVTDEEIKLIKKYGGPQNIVMEKIFEKITDPSLKRLVENKLTEIETAAFDKEQAIKKTKDDVKGYVAERAKDNEQAGQFHQTETKKELDSMLTNLKWLAPRKAEAGAKEDDKKAVENHNAFVSELQKEINAALTDDSAKMRATLLVGTTQLLYLQRVHQAAMEKMTGLEKQLKEANDFIAKYKKSSGSGLKESAAPPSGKLSEVRKSFDLSQHPGQALDDIARQVMEERRAKQVS